MPSDDPRALLLLHGRLLRRYPKATPAQRRALEALNQVGTRLERADRACLDAAKHLRRAERLHQTYRIRVLASLRRLPTGRSAAELARLTDAELLELAQGLRGQAQLRARAGFLRRAVRELALWPRRQERAQAGLARQVRAFRVARGRLAQLGL